MTFPGQKSCFSCYKSICPRASAASSPEICCISYARGFVHGLITSPPVLTTQLFVTPIKNMMLYRLALSIFNFV